jgi:hypothetical protein
LNLNNNINGRQKSNALANKGNHWKLLANQEKYIKVSFIHLFNSK